MQTVLYNEKDGTGDFRSNECIEQLKAADIVVTNPPFSLFNEFFNLLIKYDKKFLIITALPKVFNKCVFEEIIKGNVWLGYNNCKRTVFHKKIDGKLCESKPFNNIVWLTNLKVNRQADSLKLTKTYLGNEDLYPKYDNYDAIEVSRLKDIPLDYYGKMGVPQTYLLKQNPKMFNLLGTDMQLLNSRFSVKGETKFIRLVIQRKGNY